MVGLVSRCQSNPVCWSIGIQHHDGDLVNPRTERFEAFNLSARKREASDTTAFQSKNEAIYRRTIWHTEGCPGPV
ncbi:MAG: hypothetical protein ACREA0_30485, partial [bacterium]